MADSSGDAPFQQLHSALTQSGLKFRLLRHAPPFRKTLMLNSAVRATESPPTVRLQTGEALELLVGANDVEDTNPSIVFVTDLSVFLPAQHLWRTRCLTMEGKRTYFPEVQQSSNTVIRKPVIGSLRRIQFCPVNESCIVRV